MKGFVEVVVVDDVGPGLLGEEGYGGGLLTI